MTSLYELAAVAWPALFATLMLFGTSLFALALGKPSPALLRERAKVRERSVSTSDPFIALWRSLAAIALLLCPIELLFRAATMGGVALLDALPLIPEVAVASHVGRVLLWRFPITITLLAATFVKNSRRRTIAIALLSASILLLQALAGHAIDHGALSVAIYTLHEFAAATWIGAVAGLYLLGVASGPDSSLAAPARSVSTIAGCAVVAIVATGLYNAYGELGFNLRLLIDSLYGRILLWKVATLTPILLIAAYNRYVLIPSIEDRPAQSKLVRNVAAECIVLTGILGWAALLANSPPPH